MHIRSKFDGGKQVNRSQSGSWEGRCAGAGLRANEGPEWGPACWAKVTTSEPNKCFRSVSATKSKKVVADYKRKAKDDIKLKRKRRKRNDNSLQSRLDYSRYHDKGPNAIEVPSDVSASNLRELMASFYNTNVKITESTAQKIAINTIDQGDGDSNGQVWHEERRKRITSSSVGEIAKRRKTTKVNSIITKLLYSKFRGNRATDWGLLQEDVSRSEYLKLKQIDSPAGYSVTKSGLVISLEHPWLAASPDGLVYDPSFDPPQGLVELKNPYATKDKTVEEAAAGNKSFCLKIDEGGKLYLPKSHSYYYQAQCAMYCTNRQWCDLVVMTKTFYVERIAVDPKFKEKVIPKLKEFYFTAVLPELASPQTVIREPCQWITEEWKCTYLQLD